MRWEIIRRHPGKAALLFALFCVSIYVASYLIVANSAAVDAAREYALKENLVSERARVGFTGFRIRIVGQEGEASFSLVDSSPQRAVRFRVEKNAGLWKVALANPEQAASIKEAVPN